MIMKLSKTALVLLIVFLWTLGWGISYAIWVYRDATLAILFSICFYGGIICATLLVKVTRSNFWEEK
jgi:hypothetical protein